MRNHIANHPDFAACAPAASLHDVPLGFIDVGARGGVHDIVEPVAACTAVLGFEPDAEEAARLRAELAGATPFARCEIEPTALGAKSELAQLHLLTTPTNHSLRGPNMGFVHRYEMAKWHETGVLSLETRALDEILFGVRAQELYWGEFLKLDTQSTEYEILTGAPRTLNERTVAVISEVAFFQVYEGQRLFSDVEQLLRSQGFSFYGFATVHHRSCRKLNKRQEAGRERMFFADAIFFKDPLGGTPFKEQLTPRQQHVLFVCALLLEYYDFALELALHTWARGEEANCVTRLVHALAARPPQRSGHEVLAVADRIRARPEDANVELGRLVDRHRGFPDYHDLAPATVDTMCHG